VKPLNKILWVVVFAVSFAAVESAVVVYLRALYYPEGFSLPLKIVSRNHFWVELVRELATMVMLASVAVLTGTNRWQRFAYFLITFGVWDIFFYLWLKIMVNWPSSILDWDILFLLPVPWIGPVIAPVFVSFFMILGGLAIIRKDEQTGVFRPGGWAWLLSGAASALILYSFMRDTEAPLGSQQPKPYGYELLVAGVALYCGSLYLVSRRE
jgi:hypothetical protein